MTRQKVNDNTRWAKKRLEVIPEPVPDETHQANDETAQITAAPAHVNLLDPAHITGRTQDMPVTPEQEDIIPDCTNKKITIQERDQILVQLAKKWPGSTPEIVQGRLDLLNKNSVPLSFKTGHIGGQWTRKKFTDTLGDAKKRLGIK